MCQAAVSEEGYLGTLWGPRVHGLGLGFRVSGLGRRVWGLGLGVWDVNVGFGF